MSSVFVRNGDIYRPMDPADVQHLNKLPPHNFSIGFAQQMGWYFKRTDDFVTPSKLYGNIGDMAERILNTFNQRSAGTGVLLSGEKGSGKTMLAKRLSQLAATQGYPTFIINEPYIGDQFNRLIQDISQPAVVLFDEFEKVYDRQQQEKMLTLLDGTFASQKLFILTCNDKYRIDSYMRNRPGRIYYSIDFRGLAEDFIRGYCEDNLADQTQTAHIVRISGMFGHFNFDMLKAIVEEMNRYGESASQTMKWLNVRAESEENVSYNIHAYYKGRPIGDEKSVRHTYRGSPMIGLANSPWSNWFTICEAAKGFVPSEFIPEDAEVFIEITAEQYIGMTEKGSFIFRNITNEDFTLVFERTRPAYYEYAY
jgi:hypothetical protein